MNMIEEKIKIHIVGDGVFGSFLKKIFAPYVEFSETAEHPAIFVIRVISVGGNVSFLFTNSSTILLVISSKALLTGVPS